MLCFRHVRCTSSRKKFNPSYFPILDPPTVTLEQNQAAKQNQPVTFTCEVKPTSPTQKISVQWFFGATPLGPYSSTLPGGQNALPTPVETEDSQPVSIPGSPNELGGKKDLPPDVATPVAVQSQRPRPRLTPHDISNNMVFSRSGKCSAVAADPAGFFF